MRACYLGLDIGGTELKLGLLDGSGQLLRQQSVPVNVDGYQTPILSIVTSAVQDFLGTLERPPLGIGVSSTGYVDRTAGVITGSWIPGWAGSPVVETLEKATGLPTTLENDGNCMCLGERWMGAARGCDNLLCVTIGTGLGGAAMIAGRLLSGAHGMALELGHIVTHRQDGIRCSCGRSGCWERYASTSALVRQAQAAGLSCSNGKELLALVEAGEPGAQSVYAGWLDELADGLVDLLYLFDPERILLGGGIVAAGERLLQPLRERMQQRAMDVYTGRYQLCAAQLGNQAGMIGAVRVLLESGKL